jgi:hypothetical protein
MKPSLPTLLSFNGGYVDAAGYIALQGLFAAHVTGNFVTIGSSLVFGTSGVIAKLLALPMFCAVIIITRLASILLPRERSALHTILTVKLVLLILGAYLAIRLGPFVNGDAWPSILTGMTLVSAMAIQNAVHRIHLGATPPTTLMTEDHHTIDDRYRRRDSRFVARHTDRDAEPPAAHGDGDDRFCCGRGGRGVFLQSIGDMVFRRATHRSACGADRGELNSRRSAGATGRASLTSRLLTCRLDRLLAVAGQTSVSANNACIATHERLSASAL